MKLPAQPSPMLAPWVLLCALSGCRDHRPAATAAAAVAPTNLAPAPPSPAASLPSCVVAEAKGAVPSLLIEVEVPAEPSPPAARRPHKRGVIVLEGFDNFGPLHVQQVARSGELLDLGRGMSPRLLSDGSLAYLDVDYPHSISEFVRVGADGAVSRTRGGTGRQAALGAPLPFAQSPYTRDGDFMAVVDLNCGSAAACSIDLFDRFPLTSADLPIDRLPVTTTAVQQVALASDGSAFGGCTRESGLVFHVRDRATRRVTRWPLEAECAAFSAQLDRVLLMPERGPVRWLNVATGETRTTNSEITFASAAAFDRCGESAVVIGRSPIEGLQRVERVFLDGRAPHVLFERYLGYAPSGALQIDPRGWVLVSNFLDPNPTSGVRAWVVSLAGGEPVEIPIRSPDRIFAVALGR